MTAYTEKCSRSMQTETAGILETARDLFLDWVKNLQIKAAIRAERRQLLEMNDAQLKDIGLSREQALAEAARNDLPQHRMSALFRGRG
ncbi:MAG: DUF1127 domain-containing protein [Gammaproteobacteria bacterium]|nr:DUF1127 domain-containing protein [Gammaproteobacteria bacterium]